MLKRISFEIVAASFLNYKSCLDQITDYGHQMKPFFIKILNFGLGQTIWTDKFWGILGTFG